MISLTSQTVSLLLSSPLPTPPSPLPLSPLPSVPSILYTAHDLQDMSERLPNTFKVPLPDPLMKRLEYEFHSANYHLMVEVLTALRTVTGHLVKALEEGRKDYGDLETQTAPEFMLNLYEHLSLHSDVLYEIGVQSASSSHLRCLADLPLTATYSCLRLFFRWMDEGFYDFSALPFPFKVHLGYQDQQSIEQLRVRWSSTVAELMKELQQLIDVLKHSEQDITRRVNEAVNVCEPRCILYIISTLLFNRSLFLTT